MGDILKALILATKFTFAFIRWFCLFLQIIFAKEIAGFVYSSIKVLIPFIWKGFYTGFWLLFDKCKTAFYKTSKFVDFTLSFLFF